MPELPEVQTIAADLDEAVGGAVIEAVALSFPQIVAGDPDRLTRLVGGTEIRSVERLGKWVRFNLAGASGPVALLAHLKMTGQFHLGPWPEGGSEGGGGDCPDPAETLEPHCNPGGVKFPGWAKHDHAAFRLRGRPPETGTLFYRDIRKFGRLRAFTQAELEEFLLRLDQGPDPLSVEPEEFHKRVTARKGRLKGVLLDQSTVAGLGNIYVDEGLFAAGLSPLRAASGLSRAETDLLLGELRRILSASIELRGSTTSNYQGLKGGGAFQKFHRVYGRAGQPCPGCGRPIERVVVAGRSTHHCPHCQPSGA